MTPRPPARDELLELSASRLAALVRDGAVTAAALVDVHLAHLERVNPRLNAVVAGRYDAAREEARRADALVRGGGRDLPPFLGVPCTIKESFSLTGMPHTSGLVSRAGRVATEDATVVARVRAAGAIPLGVTNVSELCMWMECYNRVYGRTNNAYDPRRTPGGSSGGEGAAVGSGAAPFGIGADIGGSIRMPAFFNGVFGHKPTGGLVPGTGEYPIASRGAARFHVRGPLARRAEDLMPLLRVLAGPDGADPSCASFTLGDPAAVDLAGLTVLDVPDDGQGRVDRALAAAQRRAAAHLAQRGARVQTVRIAGFRRALAIWASMLGAASEETFGVLLGGEGPPVRALPELVRWARRASPHTFPAIGLALIEDVAARFPRARERYVREGAALRAELVERLGPNGVLLYPPHPVPAPRHDAPLFRPLRWVYTAIFNVLELPVTQVPLGLNRGGLPLGVQVAAAHGNDHLGVAVALELERAFGGWVPPWRASGRRPATSETP